MEIIAINLKEINFKIILTVTDLIKYKLREIKWELKCLSSLVINIWKFNIK